MQRPWSDFSAANVWQARNDGRCTVLAWERGDELLGVMVVSIMTCPAGRALHVEAAAFGRGGRFAPAIENYTLGLARRHGCDVILFESARRLDRIFTECEVESTTFMRRVTHE